MFLLLCLATLVTVGLTHPTYQNAIPNGHHTHNPCGGQAWHGVGHLLSAGSGPLNPFGVDFAAAGHTWTAALCRLDSDRDGRTNGAELGDPQCTWTPAHHGHMPASTGHPGICEPIGSTACAWQNVVC
ncbi:temptin [Biomphalaria glabrata]|uniref:Temptin-like n=2 Tax=Biomphalaria TaxID=6525 RepID=A0A2C9JWB1_BIOGL|nr:temptin-like [Biomphalaria glabrata]KAI8758065.1 temptin-like [Biomphalaria glabrata]KAI8791552.1 temptin [Biomphalaria glabrata]KAK0052810.1 temptin [Biomphalaria pfeifferi]